MIPLDPPDMQVKDTLTASCVGMQDLKLKARLLTRESDLSAAEQEYTQAAEDNRLFALALVKQEAEEQRPDPDGDELRDLYSAGLVNRKEGRLKYNEIKARAPFGHCLLCGISEISSMDHHLPWKNFPIYAICPANLVPACSKCNQAKGDRIGTSPNERTLHPYYDRPDAEGRYLIADVSAWPVRFHIQPRPEWSAELRQRIEHHFYIFNLLRRFAEFSISTLTSNQWLHQKMFRLGGTQALTAHLREDADQHAKSHGLNAWETALRYGLADSAWYVSQGVHEAP